MSAGGIDGSDFSRRKKHPDLAYRAHQVNKQIKMKRKVLTLKLIKKYLGKLLQPGSDKKLFGKRTYLKSSTDI